MGLKAQAKIAKETASQTERMTVITEKNWNAMINLQSTQIKRLENILSYQEAVIGEMTALPTVNTIEKMMSNQIKTLKKEYQYQIMMAENLNSEILSVSQKVSDTIQKGMNEVYQLAGNLRDQNSKQLSLETDKLDAHCKSLFMICLIPSTALIVLEMISPLIKVLM